MIEFNLYSYLADYKGLPIPVNFTANAANGSYAGKALESVNTIVTKPKGAFNNYLGQTVICGITMDDIKFGSGENGHISVAPMMMITAHKKIVKKAIAGNQYPGSIKELITFDDYRIRIWGAVVSKDQRFYPTTEVDILKRLWSKNYQLEFKCDITNDWFRYIVIEDFKLDELRIKPGVQFYEINAISDAFMYGEEIDLLKEKI